MSMQPDGHGRTRSSAFVDAAGRRPALGPTRTEEAYKELKRRIIELELPPGACLTEADVAARLELSKTPAREALTRLHVEGFVEIVARTGYRVAPVTVKMAKELFDLRAVLEGEAVHRAAQQHISPTRMETLEALRCTTYVPSDVSSVRAFLGANTAFHVELARAGGNDALADQLARVFVQLQRLFHVGLRLSSRMDEEVHEHHAMLDAVAAGNAELARELTLTQIAASGRWVVEALLSSDVVASANVAP